MKKKASCKTKPAAKGLPKGKPWRRKADPKMFGDLQASVMCDQQTPITEAALAPEIPAELKFLQGMTPAQAILADFPKAKGHPEAEATIAGWFSGISGVDFGIPIPEWARKASSLYWNATGLPLHKPLSEWSLKALGKLIGVQEKSPQEQPQLSKEARAASAFTKLIKSVVESNASAEEGIEFHTGRGQAAKVPDKLGNPDTRTKIYLLIATCWHQIAPGKLNSTTELHVWLMRNGSQLLPPNIESREVRKVCEIIGLDYDAPPGRRPRSA